MVPLIFHFGITEVYAYENPDDDGKYYCEINEEYDFLSDSVLVMIDESLSDVNKIFEESFLGDLEKLKNKLYEFIDKINVLCKENRNNVNK